MKAESTRRRMLGLRQLLVDPIFFFVFICSSANAFHNNGAFVHPARNTCCWRQHLHYQSRIGWQLYATPPEPSDETVAFDRDNNDNDTPLGRTLRGLWQTGMKESVEVKSMVVAKADLPSLGIWMDQTYELRSIYWQGVNPETNVVEQLPLDTLQNTVSKDRPSSPVGYTQYIELYNPMYHELMGAVKVTPEEVGLVSLRTEVLDSILFALPVLGFWTATSFMFAKTYNDRYGGDFLDALFGR
jgi:hypothetical protein